MPKPAMVQRAVTQPPVAPTPTDPTTRLTNISRAEPDPSLFQPPAGYQILDEKDWFTMTVKNQ
jgi:hypothetical protein